MHVTILRNLWYANCESNSLENCIFYLKMDGCINFSIKPDWVILCDAWREWPNPPWAQHNYATISNEAIFSIYISCDTQYIVVIVVSKYKLFYYSWSRSDRYFIFSVLLCQHITTLCVIKCALGAAICMWKFMV